MNQYSLPEWFVISGTLVNLVLLHIRVKRLEQRGGAP
jgi:hypothetical protein